MPPTTTMTPDHPHTFTKIWEAIRAIAFSTTLTTDVREIVSSMEYSVLITDLAAMRRPFGIVIVTPKEN